MNAGHDGPERMVELVTMLAVASKLMAGLVIRIGSATCDEMPALAAEANASVEEIVQGCAGTAPLDHLIPGNASAIRTDLIDLGDALQAHIDCLFALRRAQLMIEGSEASSTMH
jgi:hypothetical protein